VFLGVPSAFAIYPSPWAWVLRLPPHGFHAQPLAAPSRPQIAAQTHPRWMTQSARFWLSRLAREPQSANPVVIGLSLSESDARTKVHRPNSATTRRCARLYAYQSQSAS